MSKKHNNEYEGINTMQVADQLENYLQAAMTMLVIEGQSEKTYHKSIKTVKKAIKDLRKGRPDKVFSEDALNDIYGY